MTTLSTFRIKVPMENGRPILETGDRMTQAEFHRRYEQCPEDVIFELIGGIVYMASPLRLPHSRFDGEIGFVLELYRRATPGTEVLHGATTILGEESEPQPDLGLRILPEYGGQSRDSAEDEYVQGAPELLVEIAHSTRSIDMHAKRDDYQKAGVLEYIVYCVEEREVNWFHFPSGENILPNRDGVAKSRVFPGLWLHAPSLPARDSARLEEVARKGLSSRAHAAFVRQMEARKNG